jgi:hypothetical protein
MFTKGLKKIAWGEVDQTKVKQFQQGFNAGGGSLSDAAKGFKNAWGQLTGKQMPKTPAPPPAAPSNVSNS